MIEAAVLLHHDDEVIDGDAFAEGVEVGERGARQISAAEGAGGALRREIHLRSAAAQQDEKRSADTHRQRLKREPRSTASRFWYTAFSVPSWSTPTPRFASFAPSWA